MIAQRSQNEFENEDNHDGENQSQPQNFEVDMNYYYQPLNNYYQNHYQNWYRYQPYPQQRYPKEWISESQGQSLYQNEWWNQNEEENKKKISNLENKQDMRRFKYYSGSDENNDARQNAEADEADAGWYEKDQMIDDTRADYWKYL